MTAPRVRVALATRMPLSAAGGIETAVRELGPRIAERRPAWELRFLFAFVRVEPWNRIPLFGDLVAAAILAVKAFGCDLVLINGAEYAWPRTLRTRDRARTIVVWHGTRVGEIPSLVPVMSLPVKMYHALETSLQARALRARRQIAVSVTTASEIEVAYHSGIPIAVIPNGAPAMKPAATLPSRRNGRRVAWLGTNAYKKGLDIALAACRLVRETYRDVELFVIGLGAREQTPEDWVHYVGRVAHTASIECVRSADVLLATSRYEGCSVAVLEALALGVPVVAGPSVGWMVGDGGVTVSSFAPQAYAEALVALFSRPERLHAMSQAATDRARAFDWDAAADAYVFEIESCLNAI